MVNWYMNYISNRLLNYNITGQEGTISTGVGFPQGGVCSALFWAVAFDPAIEIINKYGINGNGFADDCSALVGGTRVDQMVDRLQNMLDELVEWGPHAALDLTQQKQWL